jgi:hypothetical protein
MLWDDRINFSHKKADEYTGWFNMMFIDDSGVSQVEVLYGI